VDKSWTTVETNVPDHVVMLDARFWCDPANPQSQSLMDELNAEWLAAIAPTTAPRAPRMVGDQLLQAT
jgi:hypothetical protein